MSETDKESVRQCFAKARENLPEGITEADADALQDIALRLMDRGLPRPAVFSHNDDGYCDISASFCVKFGRLVVVADGDRSGVVFAAANGRAFDFLEFTMDAERVGIIDSIVETWTKVVAVAEKGSQP